MLEKFQASILFVLLCVGCDSAAKQQQAEDARRAATVDELKQIGKAMHEEHNKESSPAAAPNDVSRSSNDSGNHESVKQSTANSSNAVDGSVNSPAAPE